MQPRAEFDDIRYKDHKVSLDRPDVIKVIDHVNKQFDKPQKLLEIGCADGSLGAHLIDNGWQVDGVELSIEAAQAAQEKGLNVSNINVEHGLPQTDKHYDAVIAMEVIEHLFDTDFFLKEVHRVIKNDGLLIITTPNLASITNRVRLLFGKIPKSVEYNIGEHSAGHIRHYTAKVLAAQIRSNGFKIINIQSTNILMPMKFMPDPIKRLAMFFGNFWPSLWSQLIVVCKKSNA